MISDVLSDAVARIQKWREEFHDYNSAPVGAWIDAVVVQMDTLRDYLDHSLRYERMSDAEKRLWKERGEYLATHPAAAWEFEMTGNKPASAAAQTAYEAEVFGSIFD